MSPVMNTTYKTIYQVDKYENEVSPLDDAELKEATQGLKKIKNDKHIIDRLERIVDSF